mgnify:CR=1 FL=1
MAHEEPTDAKNLNRNQSMRNLIGRFEPVWPDNWKAISRASANIVKQ